MYLKRFEVPAWHGCLCQTKNKVLKIIYLRPNKKCVIEKLKNFEVVKKMLILRLENTTYKTSNFKKIYKSKLKLKVIE